MVVCTTSTSKGIIAQHTPSLRAAANCGSTQILFSHAAGETHQHGQAGAGAPLDTLIEIDRSDGLKSSYRLAV